MATAKISQLTTANPSNLDATALIETVDNTGASVKVTYAQLNTANPTLTAPTQSTGDSSTKIANTTFVAAAIANAVAGVNPAVAVSYATAAILPNTPTYSNGASGIGATLTATAALAALLVDGANPAVGVRILVKNQAAAANNGIYTVTTAGTGSVPWVLTRASDFNQPNNINSTGAIPVISGTANTGTQWVISSSVTTVGTDAITFAQFSINPTSIPAYSFGTWSPIDSSGAGLTLAAANSGNYIKIGSLVYAWCNIAYPSTGSGATTVIGGLPFTTSSTLSPPGVWVPSNAGINVCWILNQNATTGSLYNPLTLAALANSALSNKSSFYLHATYSV